ncbi:FUSC family membrane protein [Sphingobacterium corticis]|uniref:FUSC family membrane protein n=1 Tax=Sphingobacterium corticis TaxID=1812823 RepID=A0ABW5NGE9_9SPHI
MATVLPGLLLFYYGHLEEGVLLGLGCLFASLTDLPGTRRDKWISALWTIPLFSLTAFITASSLALPFSLIVWLVVAAFSFTMIAVYGARFSAIGLMGLVLVTFTVGLWPENPLKYALYIGAGVSVYFGISMLQALLFPYRSLRYAMADSYHRMSILLRNKAQFYDDQISLEDAYKQLGNLHLVVSEQQEHVRSLLLRERRLIDPQSKTGKFWLQQILGVTDLYELLTALDHDYDAIRQRLMLYDVLPQIRAMILLLADEVDYLSWKSAGSLRLSKRISKDHEIQHILARLSEVVNNMSNDDGEILRATIRNTEHILACIQRVRTVLREEGRTDSVVERFRYESFVHATPKGFSAIRKQFSFRNAIFPFALRLALLFGIGGTIGLFLPEYHYTYWILITLVVVARPSYAITNRRNSQRIVGTLLGVSIGFLFILLLPSPGILLLLAMFGLFGFFFFNRIDYMLSVMSLTPAIVIALHVYEGGIADILGSRVVFTLIGCLLAFLGWFFIPVRQSRNLLALAEDVVVKSEQYVDLVMDRTRGTNVESNDMRLARKMAHGALASYSAALDQVRREPGSRKRNWSSFYEFHSLAYRLNSLTVGLSVATNNVERAPQSESILLPRTAHVSALQADLGKMIENLSR